MPEIAGAWFTFYLTVSSDELLSGLSSVWTGFEMEH